MYFIEDPEMWTTTVGPARPRRRRSSDRTGELMAESIDEAGAALHGGATGSGNKARKIKLLSPDGYVRYFTGAQGKERLTHVEGPTLDSPNHAA